MLETDAESTNEMIDAVDEIIKFSWISFGNAVLQACIDRKAEGANRPHAIIHKIAPDDFKMASDEWAKWPQHDFKRWPHP